MNNAVNYNKLNFILILLKIRYVFKSILYIMGFQEVNKDIFK